LQTVESAPFAICLVAPDGRLLEVNDALCALTGYDRQTLLSMRGDELAPPGAGEAGAPPGPPARRRCVRADGREVAVLLTVSPLDPDGGRDTVLLAQIVEAGELEPAPRAVPRSWSPTPPETGSWILAGMSVEWQAKEYHALSGPMEAMGLAVLDRLELRGDETVLDAGCGSGRVTAHLLERLPHGRVIAVDRSAAMVEQARAFLPGRAEVIHADLLELELGEPVDAVLSTATFHWILDHERLFARLHALLRPGGRLVAQCGGYGNIARPLAAAAEVASRPPFAAHFAGWSRASLFATAEETAARLAAAGFAEVRCWLADSPVAPEDPAAYLRTITLRDHLTRLPAELEQPFVEAVVELLPRPVVLDYVRLNLDGRRPG
jgi:trans-aconitate 2-methyltransferase